MEKNIGFIINEEKRQHINLSEKTMKTIERDMIYFNRDFDLKNKSGFLNRVFENYYTDFPLAPNVVLKNITKIYQKLNQDNVGKRIIEKIVDEFSSEIMSDSIATFKDMYSSEVQFKLKLNNSSSEILENFEEAFYFDEFAPRSGVAFYLKGIFESYASLPREKREQIFFRDEIDVIQKAITSKRKLIIKQEDKYLTVVPYDFSKEMEKQNHQLQYLEPMDDFAKGDRFAINPNVISLNKIESIRLHKPFTDTEEQVVNMMKQNQLGVDIIPQHISNKKKLDVVVEFTYYGNQRFIQESDDLTIIGLPDGTGDERRYTFHATESEIFWDLFKYGSHAKIIKPIELRNKFKAFYEHAAKKYGKSTQDEE